MQDSDIHSANAPQGLLKNQDGSTASLSLLEVEAGNATRAIGWLTQADFGF